MVFNSYDIPLIFFTWVLPIPVMKLTTSLHESERQTGCATNKLYQAAQCYSHQQLAQNVPIRYARKSAIPSQKRQREI